MSAPTRPGFAFTSCSQCGNDFGPCQHGFSHCEKHAGKCPLLNFGPIQMRQTTARVETAIRSVRNASHSDISGFLTQVSAMVKNSGSLSEACISLVVDELDDLADRVDADLVSQQMASDFDNRDRRAA